MAQNNTTVKDTVYWERPDKFLEINDYGTYERRGGSDGKIAWTINPEDGARLFEGDLLSIILSSRKFNVLEIPLTSYKSMKTEGIEQINGKDCYKVVKTPEKGNEKIVYYDKKSFLIVKESDQRGNNKFEVYFEEYKKINGILFPYKEVHFSNGQKLEEITTEKIELNIEMPEGIFDIPEEIKAIMKKTNRTKALTKTGKGTCRLVMPGRSE